MDILAWKKLKKVASRQQELLDDVANLTGKVDHIMATQAELTVKLQEISQNLQQIGDGVTKVGSETTTLLSKIEELKTAAANADPALLEVVNAVAAQAQVVADRVKGVDALVPDAQ